MERLYATLGEWEEGTRERVWRRWLWESDCNAPPLEQCCDMNQMHVLGVLCCLEEARVPPVSSIGPLMLPHTPVVHLYPEVPISRLSLRQLLDQLECLQLHWGPVLTGMAMSAEEGVTRLSAEMLLRALMARLGEIARHAYTEEEGVLDDPQHCTPLPPGEQTRKVISRKSLRQAICVLFSLMRVQEVLARSEAVAEPSEKERSGVIDALRPHHVEAAGDLFRLASACRSLLQLAVACFSCRSLP